MLQHKTSFFITFCKDKLVIIALFSDTRLLTNE